MTAITARTRGRSPRFDWSAADFAPEPRPDQPHDLETAVRKYGDLLELFVRENEGRSPSRRSGLPALKRAASDVIAFALTAIHGGDEITATADVPAEWVDADLVQTRALWITERAALPPWTVQRTEDVLRTVARALRRNGYVRRAGPDRAADEWVEAGLALTELRIAAARARSSRAKSWTDAVRRVESGRDPVLPGESVPDAVERMWIARNAHDHVRRLFDERNTGINPPSPSVQLVTGVSDGVLDGAVPTGRGGDSEDDETGWVSGVVVRDERWVTVTDPIERLLRAEPAQAAGPFYRETRAAPADDPNDPLVRLIREEEREEAGDDWLDPIPTHDDEGNRLTHAEGVFLLAVRTVAARHGIRGRDQRLVDICGDDRDLAEEVTRTGHADPRL